MGWLETKGRVRDLNARGKTDTQESQKSEAFGEWGFVSKCVKSPIEIHKPFVFCLLLVHAWKKFPTSGRFDFNFNV